MAATTLDRSSIKYVVVLASTLLASIGACGAGTGALRSPSHVAQSDARTSPPNVECSFGLGATVRRSVERLSGDLGIHTLLTHTERYDGLWVAVDGDLRGTQLCPRNDVDGGGGCVDLELTDLPRLSVPILDSVCHGRHVHVAGIFQMRGRPHLLAEEIFWTSPEGDLIE